MQEGRKTRRQSTNRVMSMAAECLARSTRAGEPLAGRVSESKQEFTQPTAEGLDQLY